MADPVTPPNLPDFAIQWDKKIPYLFGTLPIVIEYFAGDLRTKVSSSGFCVENKMPAAYGYILGTTDAHGEEIDMYLDAHPDVTAPIYVIDQINPGTGLFDEHKVMLGFSSLEHAVMVYQSVFADGSGGRRLGAISQFEADAFSVWLTSDGTSLKPALHYRPEGVTGVVVAGIVAPFNPHDRPKPRDVGGAVIETLPDLSAGPLIVTKSEGGDQRDYHIYFYEGLTFEMWGAAIDTICRILELARTGDKVHYHIASPGGSVVLMGRVLSAFARTKAKVITYAEGGVASAATSIWAAGHERHILPGAYFMQHMSSQMLMGKTPDIQARAAFCLTYVEKNLQALVTLGLFTQQEVDDMIAKSSDIYISGREAIARLGAISPASAA